MCFGLFIGATIPSAELRGKFVEALLTLPSQALLLLCHLDDDLVITNKGSEVWDMSDVVAKP